MSYFGAPSVVRRASIWLAPFSVVVVLVALVGLTAVDTEPFFWNDETRHVMTGVFFRDFFADGGWTGARAYAERYYLQYPSLGLLVWPPLFYVIEGLVMLVFGSSLAVAKMVVLTFSAIASVYLYALVARTHDRRCAWLASLLFAVSPMTLSYARQVMLEMPMLAFGLAALYHAVAHLDTGRRLHLWLAAAASSAAVLTRFDGAVLLPVLLVLVALRGEWRRVARLETALAGLAALGAVMPVVWLTVRDVGAVHLATIVPSAPDQNGWAWAFDAVAYYLRALPEQLGPVVPVAAAVGIVAALRSAAARRRHALYLALVLCTYLVFTAIAEKAVRHTILWTPAFAALAACGAATLARRRGVHAAATALLILFTLWSAVGAGTPYVRGYADAARYVQSHTSASRFTLFDGFYDGTFIYQMRQADQERRLWVLRGDKVLYASVINVGNRYTEFTASDMEMKDVLRSYDPELVVVESMPVGGRSTPAGQRLRRLLVGHPEQYRLERRLPVRASSRSADGVELLIYRSLVRNPTPRTSVELNMLTMGGQRMAAPTQP